MFDAVNDRRILESSRGASPCGGNADDSRQLSLRSDARIPNSRVASAIGSRTGNSNGNSDVTVSELEEAVVSYHDQLLPRLVVGGAVRRAALRAELVGAKADRVLLSERVAKAEAENATLRAQLESRKGGG